MRQDSSSLALLYFLQLNNVDIMDCNKKAYQKANDLANTNLVKEIVHITDPKLSGVTFDYHNSSTREILANINNREELIEAIKQFDACELKASATNTVISDGSPEAKIMFLGEAPGATEDEMGIPFCGESGKLLDNMLSAIGLSRASNIYISNTIFWRPPDNRKPTDHEIELCRPFVEKHIAIIKPKLIVVVGATAGTSLIGKNFQITKMRRHYFSYKNMYLDQEIPVTAIFHPAYLLRQSSQKKNTWYDLLDIKKYIETNIPNFKFL